MKLRWTIPPLAVVIGVLISLTAALGQEPIISFTEVLDAFQIAGGSASQPQILVSGNDYWGVIRAAGDLAKDFGQVTGTNFSLSNGETGAEPAVYMYNPITANYTHYSVNVTQCFYGPDYAEPSEADTVVIVGTVGHSKVIGDLVSAGKLDVSAIEGKWESFTTQLVEEPILGSSKAVVIAGSDPRGTIFGIYDISEQIGVSPWYWWADVPVKQNKDIFVLPGGKVQGPPSVRYRGFFINDEQPGLSGWVQENYPDTPYGVGYAHAFYGKVFEVLLRLRANYLWPALWATMFEIDDPANQPLADAWEVVLGSSHTEPMMRAQNEFSTFYTNEGLGPWAYNENNATIDEYFAYGAQRAKPYARNSLWTMGMRGTGDTAIEGLGVDVIVSMLENLVERQRAILEDVLEVDATEVPQTWCLYKEVMSYILDGLTIPEDVTLLWADDNWGNIRRVPIADEKARSGGAGVYYHFDYVGDPRSYKWINTIQLEKTAEQMQLAYAHGADRIWVVNVGDLKPLEIPLTHFLDMAYDIDKWSIDNVSEWTQVWAAREFGLDYAEDITNIMTRYSMYAARRKYEVLEPNIYSTINYNEADAILEQWAVLANEAQGVYAELNDSIQEAFFEMILHPILAGQIVHKIHINAQKNTVWANQGRNSANGVISEVLADFKADGQLTTRWDQLLDGKWKRMLDQTHIGFNGYWQQPMRNVLPALSYVQSAVSATAGNVGIAVEGLNASTPGDDRYHTNSATNLVLPALDPYGASTRWFEVFSRGTMNCDWRAESDLPWVRLSQYSGTVGTSNGTDIRVLVSIDWTNAPQIVNSTMATINFTTGCGREGFANWYGKPLVQLPINLRSVPSSFTEGFVESDAHIAIEGPHYQRIYYPPSSSNQTNNTTNTDLTYHTLHNYGRTLGGVTLWPQKTLQLTPATAPALEYDIYLFSNTTAANVTLYLSPTQNYLSDNDPVTYAVSLFPTTSTNTATAIITTPQVQVRTFVGPSIGTGMPSGWGSAVADAVWGVDPAHTNMTTAWDVPSEGAYTLRVWGLAPGVTVQKIVVDLGGVRPSYLGPPESFLVGRDEEARAASSNSSTGTRTARTSFAHVPGVVGRLGGGGGAERLIKA